jgi:acetyl esterase/lipase
VEFAATWGWLSRAERNAAYNNTEAVKNSPALNEARMAASAKFRAEHSDKLDIPYGAAERQKWDLFPAAKADAPCFVFIHGGYWQRGKREENSIVGAGLYAHGWSVALPGYTLTPEATLTEIVEEIHAALDWLAAHGAEHGITGKVVLSGWSAGGHLAAMAVRHERVSAGLPVSGVYELGPIRDTYLNDAVRLTDLEIETLSPLRLPMVDKPMDIAYGSAELPPLVHDPRDLHAIRAGAHLPGALIPVAGADHFTILDQLRKPDGLLVKAALNLV